jgi:tetratricopeptide (TPR) repeat protein
MNKSDAETLLRQGIELYDLGRFQEAIVMFERALALFPNLSPYAGDFNHDRDVDGSDLAVLVAKPNLIDLLDFAADFGKTN